MQIKLTMREKTKGKLKMKKYLFKKKWLILPISIFVDFQAAQAGEVQCPTPQELTRDEDDENKTVTYHGTMTGTRHVSMSSQAFPLSDDPKLKERQFTGALNIRNKNVVCSYGRYSIAAPTSESFLGCRFFSKTGKPTKPGDFIYQIVCEDELKSKQRAH